MTTKTSTARRVRRGAVAAVAAGLALGLVPGTSAWAAGPVVTVTPSTGLSDGSSVTVAVSGMQGSQAGALECAQVAPGSYACDVGALTSIPLDASGSGSAQKVVHTSFTGYLVSDGSLYGTVNCATVAGGCEIDAGDNYGDFSGAAISFG